MSEDFIKRTCLNCIRIMCEVQEKQNPNYVCEHHKFEHECMIEKLKGEEDV